MRTTAIQPPEIKQTTSIEPPEPPQKSSGINFAVLLVSFFLSLLIAEATARIFLPDLSRGLYDVQKDNRLQFIPFTRSFYKTREFKVDFQINAEGRRDKAWTHAAIANPNNILFVGDSFVLGYGLSDLDSIPTQMERIYASQGDTKEVFNYGIGGSVALPEYRMLMEQALDSGIQANEILIGIFIGNDFIPESVVRQASFLDRSRLFQWLRRGLGGSPDVIRFLFKTGSLTGVQIYQSPESYLFSKTQNQTQKHYFEKQLTQLSAIAQLAKAENRNISVIIFPSKIQVENSPELNQGNYQYDLPNQKIREYCAERQIPVLDLLPILKEKYQVKGKPLYYPIDRHLNPRGAALAASSIYEFIQSKRGMPR